MATQIMQSMVWTVLPFGQITFPTTTDGFKPGQYLDFSVIVSPRLESTSTDQLQLQQFPDWIAGGPGGRSWPETVAALQASLTLDILGLTTPVKAHARLVHKPVVGQLFGSQQPDKDVWNGMFSADTPVTPYLFKGMEKRTIRSSGAGALSDVVTSLYGHFGMKSPTLFPTYASLVAPTAFGPMGFNDSTRDDVEISERDPKGGHTPAGLARKNHLTTALDNALKNDRFVAHDFSNVPGLGANPPASTLQALAFLQEQQFLQRPHADAGAAQALADKNPKWDFHQIVAGAASLPSLMRALGLVLDLRAGPFSPSVFNDWEAKQANHKTVAVEFAFNGAKLNWPKASTLPHANNNDKTMTVRPPTAALISKGGVFEPQPLDPTHTDLDGRMLKVGDQGLFRLIRLDHDNAAVKAMQLADNITRSRAGGKKLTLTTPDRFALPALRTGGFAIARTGRAEQMAKVLARQTNVLQKRFFDHPTGKKPALHAEDITRGYRFDVFNKAQTDVWLSLMWRQGTIAIPGAPTLDVLEEDTIVPAPTTAGLDTGSSDLYLQETLTKWDGWSLAVPRIGTSFYDARNPAPNTPSGSEGFNVTTDWHVPGAPGSGTVNVPLTNFGKLPPLRFGQSYTMRARAVDLAGNSLPVTSAPTNGIVVTRSERHLRYEPSPAPRMLLLGAPHPGASEEVVVVRSESGADQTNGGIDTGTADRMIVPASLSIFMAEQHGAFDIPDPDAAGKQEMDASLARYQDLAARDATTLADLGQLVDPTFVHSQTNPYLFPSVMPITYLPEFIGRVALVRGLPPNSGAKKTTAKITFDPEGTAWPKLNAGRILLRKGTNDWGVVGVPDAVTGKFSAAELVLDLDVGNEIVCLLNSEISAGVLDIMAVWEQIQIKALAAGWTQKQINTLEGKILAGEHWMFTPWREIKFVHAVRTPLMDPILYLEPQKSAIGETKAEFNGLKNALWGTVAMSRKSTARIDVNGTWTMPIDTGANRLTRSASTFSGIVDTAFAETAFSLDIARVGLGKRPDQTGTSVIATTNFENFDEVHEFNDTKFRAVTYEATATSHYIEYFREELTLSSAADPIQDLRTQGQVKPGVPFEGATVKLSLVGTDNSKTNALGQIEPQVQVRPLVQAPVGTAASVAAPTPGDYIVVEDPTLNSSPATATNGYIQILDNSPIKSSDIDLSTKTAVFSYVGPTIHTFSDPVNDKTTSTQMHVPNSKRPSAPSPLYVIPVTNRDAVTNTDVAWTRNALRVYLNRPWWSSGDRERLGVVCWHAGSSKSVVPPTDLSPYVTQWGFDPIHQSRETLSTTTKQPTPSCFPLATAKSSNASLTIEEISTKVDVAGHSVQYDKDRDLWFADIKVTSAKGNELESYTPFIRFALARYQPTSIDNAHLSKVVTVDYAQLAPNRHVTMTGNITTGYTVTVAGYAPVGEIAQTTKSTNIIRITVEQQDTRITDPALTWKPLIRNEVVESTDLVSSVSHTDKVTWTGGFNPGTTASPVRLAIEEFEVYEHLYERLVWTDTIPIPFSPT
jgi:hypothetical protein